MGMPDSLPESVQAALDSAEEVVSLSRDVFNIANPAFRLSNQLNRPWLHAASRLPGEIVKFQNVVSPLLPDFERACLEDGAQIFGRDYSSSFHAVADVGEQALAAILMAHAVAAGKIESVADRYIASLLIAPSRHAIQTLLTASRFERFTVKQGQTLKGLIERVAPDAQGRDWSPFRRLLRRDAQRVAGCWPKEPLERDDKRPCYHRDHQWLEWYEDEKSETHRSPATIRDKWNREHPTRPIDSGNNGRDTVKAGIRKASQERELEEKTSEN